MYNKKVMIEIVEVKTKKEKKLFVDFPTKLYKNCENYTHPLRMDEINLFDKNKNVSYEDCDVIYYLAKKDGEVVGRIAGIIQKLYNEKTSEKRVRFSRFDCINDVEVSNALFSAVEKWAKEKGMNKIHGPMGFNDLDREGMLIEGFEYPATYEEQYNFDYYPKLVEAYGFEKEVDWVEFRIYPPTKMDERVERLSDAVLKRYKLKVATGKNKKQFIEKYKQSIFEVLDLAYGSLYGVVPFTDKLRDQIISNFYLFIKMEYIIVLVDENDKVVAFGFAIPGINKAIRKSKGKLFPFGIFRLLHAVKKSRVADFGLVGVRPEYQGKGLTAVILRHIMNIMIKNKIEYCETNLNLEDNLKIQQTWKNFEHLQHKRRRSYVKKIN